MSSIAGLTERLTERLLGSHNSDMTDVCRILLFSLCVFEHCTFNQNMCGVGAVPACS